MEREISIILKVKGAATAKKAVEDVFNNATLNSVTKFTVQTKKAGDATERLGRKTKQTDTSMKSFTKTLGRGMAALYLYNRAWNTFGAQFESGLNLQRASEQFEMNVGSVNKMLPELQTATRGIVADFDLLKTASRAFQQGLKPGQMASAFKMGTIAAQRLGLSATESINTITQALTRQDEGALNTLGIITNVNLAYRTQAALIAKNGGVMSKAMGVQLRQSLIMKELQARFGGVNQVQDDGLAVLERFRASWKNFRAEIGKSIGIALVPLTRTLTGLLDVVTGLLKRMNDTSGFKTFVQLSATLAGIWGGVKIVTAIKGMTTLLGMTGSSKLLKSILSLSDGLGTLNIRAKGVKHLPKIFKTLRYEMKLGTAHGMTKTSVALGMVQSGLRGVWDSLKNIGPQIKGFARLGGVITLVSLAAKPLIKSMSKLWSGAKVFFQLINNLDEDSGMSKVLRKDAEAVGGMFNFIENRAKNFLQIKALISGVFSGLGAVFTPIGMAIEWTSDKLGGFIERLLGVEKNAVLVRSELEKLARIGKVVGGVLGGALAGSAFGPKGALIGALIGGTSAVLSDVDWKAVEAHRNIKNPTLRSYGPPDNPLSMGMIPTPQQSTQISTPTPRAMNVDFTADWVAEIRGLRKDIKEQTGIMEDEVEAQRIKDSQNRARGNVFPSR